MLGVRRGDLRGRRKTIFPSDQRIKSSIVKRQLRADWESSQTKEEMEGQEEEREIKKKKRTVSIGERSSH